jgi:hypothetical protein
MPSWLKEIRRAMHAADAVHIRCPAVISLVALLAARLWAKNKPVWVKYAGELAAQRQIIPVSSHIQRWLLFKNNFIKVSCQSTGNGQNNPGMSSHLLTHQCLYKNMSLPVKKHVEKC